MQDMLVRLLDLPELHDLEEKLRTEGIIFRRPIPPEKEQVAQWARQKFSSFWANEVEAAFSYLPVHCFIAQKEQEILGFACYECTAKNFFGPSGVEESYRGKKIGQILLVKALEGLKELGYTYGIIGGVGPHQYYQKTVGAQLIPGSEKSIYTHLLKNNHAE